MIRRSACGSIEGSTLGRAGRGGLLAKSKDTSRKNQLPWVMGKKREKRTGPEVTERPRARRMGGGGIVLASPPIVIKRRANLGISAEQRGGTHDPSGREKKQAVLNYFLWAVRTQPLTLGSVSLWKKGAV